MLAGMITNCVSVLAQKEVKVTSVVKTMSYGITPGFMVNIPEAKLKEITPQVKKYLEEGSKARAKETDGEMVIYGAVNKNFSSKPYNAYTKMLETTDGIELTLFVTEDSITFISDSSEADKVAAIKKSLYDFAINSYKGNVEKQLKAETEKVSELKKTLEKQMNKENDNIEDIGKKQREIEKYNTRIEENKGKIKAKNEQVLKQKDLVDRIDDKKSPEHSLAVKNLKNYEGEKRDLEKESEKMARNIEDNKADIKMLEHKNDGIRKEQDDTKQKIEAQSQVVKNVEGILNGVK